MRTTVNVDDHLLAAAKRRAREQGRTLGDVVEDALRRDLADPAPSVPPEVPVFKGGEGPVAGLDLTSNRAMREALDLDAELDALR